MKTVKTDLLEIAYPDEGPSAAPVLLLLHGWPDDAHGMTALAERLRVECFPAGVRRTILEGVGHFPAREAPDVVATAIVAFLAEMLREG
jgi:pimeloyl-ACP methyl ester carboxylesterase